MCVCFLFKLPGDFSVQLRLRAVLRIWSLYFSDPRHSGQSLFSDASPHFCWDFLFLMAWAIFRGWPSLPSATWATPLPTPWASSPTWNWGAGASWLTCGFLSPHFLEECCPAFRERVLPCFQKWLYCLSHPSLPSSLFLFVSLKKSLPGVFWRRFQHEFSPHSWNLGILLFNFIYFCVIWIILPQIHCSCNILSNIFIKRNYINKAYVITLKMFMT